MSQLAAGERVGRYVVLCRLGSGGTGSVYSAFDPELDRKVALRVPAPPSGFSEARDSETRACFLAESQAVARLAHPNVVAIHDVGSSGGRVFVAMELVDGQTLSAWLASSGHPWLVVLEVFIAAGRGLAAAHAAGLVHRDFNIDSVIVGKDRRARVTG